MTKAHELRPGDIIRVGQRLMRVDYIGGTTGPVTWKDGHAMMGVFASPVGAIEEIVFWENQDVEREAVAPERWFTE